MDLQKTALYVLAGYGIYVMYQKYVAKTNNGGSNSEPKSQADCPKDTKFRVQNGGINGSFITACVPNIRPQQILPLIHPLCPKGYEKPIKTGQSGANEFTCSEASYKTNECNRQFNNWYLPSFGGATESVYRSAFNNNCHKTTPCLVGKGNFEGACTSIKGRFENPPQLQS